MPLLYIILFYMHLRTCRASVYVNAESVSAFSTLRLPIFTAVRAHGPQPLPIIKFVPYMQLIELLCWLFCGSSLVAFAISLRVYTPRELQVLAARLLSSSFYRYFRRLTMRGCNKVLGRKQKPITEREHKT